MIWTNDHVVVLGGAGGMGRCIATSLLGEAPSLKVEIADRDLERAEDVARQLGDRASAGYVDVRDPAALRRTLSGAALAINAVGPYFRFGVPITKAAIDARCDLADICDDPEATVEILALNGAARAAGVRVVTGLGASPGVTNLLAVLAVRELDTAESVITGWNGEGATPDASLGVASRAAIEHGVEQATGLVREAVNDAEVERRPLQRIEVDYPGIGRRVAWTFGHPEAVTLHRALGLATSRNVTHGRRRFVGPLRAVAGLVDRGRLSKERAVRLVLQAERVSPSPSLASLASPRRLPPLFAVAQGTRHGRRASIGATLLAYPGRSMGAVTGVPAAIGAAFMLQDHTGAPGVRAPESALDPDAFFQRMARHAGWPDGEPPVLLTRSWDDASGAEYRRAMTIARREIGS